MRVASLDGETSLAEQAKPSLAIDSYRSATQYRNRFAKHSTASDAVGDGGGNTPNAAR